MNENVRLTRRALLRSAAGLGAMAGVLAGSTRLAFAETTLQRARRDGFIRIGFANEAPFGYATADGKLTGEAPEVAKAVLAKIGIPQVDGVLTEFGSLIPGLKAHRFDIIAAGMFITPKRCQEIAFSEPSYGIGESMLVKKGNPKSIKDYSSIASDKSLKLAVMAGAVEVGYAKDAGVPDDQLVVLPDQSSLLAAVQSGRADAGSLTALSVADMAKKGEDVEATTPFGEVNGKSVKGHGGFGFRKEDKDLYKAFNTELKKFIGTPEHIALVTPFGFGKDFLPNKTMEQLCKGE
jgi:polar amino acid transport system substrate-binding protein